MSLVPTVDAAPRATASPVVSPVVDTVAMTVSTPVGTAEGERSAGGIRELRRERPFAMAAMSWTGRAPDLIEVRSRRLDGQWGEWIKLDTVGRPMANQPDKVDTTEPVWLGDSTWLRVRAERDGAPMNVNAMTMVLIDPGRRSADTRVDSSSPAVTSRAGWGADESVRTRCYQHQGIGVDYGETVRAATIHHTVSTNNYSAADSARIVRGIYAFHAITRQWCDIGYNALVDRFGRVFEGRFGGLDRPVWGAHAGGFNRDTLGVAMIGEFGGVAPSSAQLEGVARFVAWKFAKGYRDPNGTVTLVSSYGGAGAKYPQGTAVTLPKIYGHRDVVYTDCPGSAGYRKLPVIRERVAAMMGNWTASPIYHRWLATGGESGPLRGVFEIEREAAGGGRQAMFASGGKSVYWSSGTGAWIIEGGIRDKWAQYGGEGGRLGYPWTDELGTPDGVGRFNHFSRVNGSIYWTPATGAHEIEGAIKTKWTQMEWERGPLGYPVTDELGTPDGVGRFNHFSRSNGSIYWTPTTGAHEVRGAIKQRWAELGWERSFLGYPVSDEYSIAGGRRSNFQGGYITWNSATGKVSVSAHQAD